MVHRTAKPASAPIGHPVTGNASAASVRAASYRPDDAIKKADTDAQLLTIAQADVLCCWCDWHNCSTFEDRDGNQFPLQAILDLYHASIIYETFDSWHEEDSEAARKAYVAICRKHSIKHGAV